MQSLRTARIAVSPVSRSRLGTATSRDVRSCAGSSCHIPAGDTAAEMSLRQGLRSSAYHTPSPGPAQAWTPPSANPALGCAAPLASSYSQAQEL